MTPVAPKSFRFIAFSAADAATNMAIDEAILEAHLAGLVPPTLRLYGFEPPAVSLGHTQKIPEGLADRADARGFNIVRRPTGGRAVLHLGDLTYSFVASSRRRRFDAVVPVVVRPASGQVPPFLLENSAAATGDDVETGILAEPVSAAYKQICGGLQIAFESLGLNLELGNTEVPYRQLHDCFLATTGSDLHFNGKKMVGSAQLRRKSGVLQHGSILLDQPQSLLPELLGQKIEDVEGAIRHANLFEALGSQISLKEMGEAIQHGFESAFGAQFQTVSLSEHELRLVDQLKLKYETI